VKRVLKLSGNSEQAFDCVEMKRKASLKLHRRLSKMTEEERVAFWQEQERKMIEMRGKAIEKAAQQAAASK
jgi:hypothetical protein